MAEWLYEIVQEAEPSRRPDFSQSSAIHWMEALRFEIANTHGATAEEQFRSARTHYERVRARPNIPHMQAVFEPLFASVSYSTSLISLAGADELPGWKCSGAIIEWYYAVYNATRSMLAAVGAPPPDKHARVADSLNETVSARLPHPLNMHAVWERGDRYTPRLPTHPDATPREGNPNPLTENLDGTSKHAREMLLAYLRGTATYYTASVKAALLTSKHFRENGWRDFRGREARQARDARLQQKIYNFLHLAFRYRGKSNYRDAIFLAYGVQRLEDGRPFIADLAFTARFTTICALAYIEKRAPADYQRFREDLALNYAGGPVFWGEFV